MPAITLRDAIDLWVQERDAPANAYEWYRRGAHRSGTVYFGPATIPAHKVGGTWYVEEADFERALAAHRAQRAEVKRATDDLRAGVLHGRDGDRIETEWGYYERRDPFHFRYDEYEAMRRRSDGWWYCNGCMVPVTKHIEGGVVTGAHCPKCAAVVGFYIE